MTIAELIALLEKLRSLMITVATGGAQIGTVQHAFRQGYLEADDELQRRGITDALPFSDLWQWHGHWSNGSLPTYASRRAYVSELFDPLLKRIRASASPEILPTGWERVDRAASEMRKQLAAARTEEQFQGVGLLGREILISLAQAVFDPVRHPIADGVAVSATDFKRMIEAFIAVELMGSSGEEVRRHARAASILRCVYNISAPRASVTLRSAWKP